jgi:Mlc titration factor MtfA (ptsG expression regulator)
LAFVLVLAAFLVTIAALLLHPAWVARRRRLLRLRPLSEAMRAIVRRNVPLAARLPATLRRRLEGDMQVFLAEKSFIGCQGMAITDEVRATIAAQACLLTLQRGGGYPRLSNVLVYPGAFVVERVRPEPSGILQEQRQVLSGESWVQGQVVLSWEDVLEGTRDPDDGRNVVVHEFSHQLDQEKGYANGAPWMASRTRRARWSAVFAQAYAALQWRAANGQPSLLSDYGATAPAEFFAVACEVFFERPAALCAEDPALYSELRDFFGLDPLAW